MSPARNMSTAPGRSASLHGAVSAVLADARSAFWGAAAFSFAINILCLTGSFYTLQIYDRVIPSRSTPTLIALTILAIALYAAYAALDFLRGRILSRAGLMITAALEHQTIAAQSALALSDSTRPRASEPLSDLDRIRAFLSGSGPTAMLDLPWVPVYLAAIYILHPVLGLTVTAAALGLLLLAVLSEASTRVRRERAAAGARERTALADTLRHNAVAAYAMGLGPGLETRWCEQSRTWLKDQTAAADTAHLCSAAARLLRLLCQIAVLCFGALLVINDGMSAGAIVAASIITARVLSSVDAGLVNWSGYSAFRKSCGRLSENLGAAHARGRQDDDLPAPETSVAIEHLTVIPAGAPRPLVHDLSFKLGAGDGLGIIGASGSGKSTLARALVGAAEPRAGTIRLDGAPLSRWTRRTRGKHIGYLPQNATLLPGNIGDNISRFEANAGYAGIVAAAKTAGIHDVIMRLPEGYHTRVEESGVLLSAGERQRIALARALYGDPFLVVLDEPDANLDGPGVASLNDAIRTIRQRGGIVVVLSHRLTAFEGIDMLMSLSNGRLQAFGRKDEVLRRVLDPAPQSVRSAHSIIAPLPASATHATLKIVSDNQGGGPA